MDIIMSEGEYDFKPEPEPVKIICRCCLSTGKPMKSIIYFEAYFKDLTGLNMSESDGLPQWLCAECCMLLQKAVRFKYKALRAHTVLYQYLTRCAPFPIDGADPELSRYASPQLRATATLTVGAGGAGGGGGGGGGGGSGRVGYHRVLQHKKQTQKTELDAVEVPFAGKEESDVVKEEMGFSDYEDNITLEEYRSNVTKLTEEVPKITEDDLDQLLQDTERQMERDLKKKRKPKRKEKQDAVKKKKNGELHMDPETNEPKTSIRKPVELDPTKIRVVTLNPEEQVKQREEESKLNLKFPFQCTLCFKGFNFEAKLNNHMNKHSPARGVYKCELCSMHLPTSYSYSVHSLIHTRRYECLRCGRRMIDRASILDHYRSQHEGVLTVFTCHICGKMSSNSKTHRGHMRNHHSGDRPKCDQCGKSFVNNDSLAEHMQIHQGIKNYSCGECGKRFRTRTQIKHHQLKHSDVKQFYCVECDVRFKSSHSLRQHLQKSLKHKDKQSFKFPCDRCDKRFESDRRLQHHARVQHEGERRHRCAQCSAALATSNSLSKHVRAVHGGHRPPPRHVCDTCGKAFRGKSVLTNHARTHTGEKPFECGECGRTFAQRTALRTHVKLVHLKMRRAAKIKPEMPAEVREPPKLDLFSKEEPPLVFDSWSRPPLQPCDVYFQVTAGP